MLCLQFYTTNFYGARKGKPYGLAISYVLIQSQKKNLDDFFFLLDANFSWQKKEKRNENVSDH